MQGGLLLSLVHPEVHTDPGRVACPSRNAVGWNECSFSHRREEWFDFLSPMHISPFDDERVESFSNVLFKEEVSFAIPHWRLSQPWGD